jgi:Fuc2NAc and GlcNAc transferase
LAGGAFVIAAILTWVLARQFAGTSLMDLPNERSSHQRPVPRGGGLAMVVACILSLSLLQGLELLEFNAWFAFGLIGLAVGLAGFLDDQRLVSLEFRLLTQFVAAFLGVIVVGGLPPLPLGILTLDFGWGADLIGCLFLVWCMNLFNFMDGIDGIAASQAALIAASAAGLAFVLGLDGAHIGTPLIIACAAAGFLVWNFPPARIFMGSVGSEYLGFFLGLTVIYLANADVSLFWSMLILLALLISDATMTLLMRLFSGENILHAHRSHAYQFLALRFSSHAPVTLGALAITAFWLAPLAFLTAQEMLSPILALFAAYAPLCVFVFYYRLRKRAAAPASSNADTTK